MTNDNNFELQEIIVENFHLDAPVEIENGILYLNKSTREVSLMLKLNLLSAEISEISSVTVEIECLNDAMEQIPNINPYQFTYRDIFLLKNSTFGQKNPIRLDERIRRVKVYIQRVVYVDSTIWYPASGSFSSPKQKRIKNLEMELFQQFLRDSAELSLSERDSTKFLPEEYDKYWLCTCGRPNIKNASTCCRCGILKDFIFNIANEKNLRRNLDIHKENLRLIEEKMKHKKEQLRLIKEEQARLRAGEEARQLKLKQAREKRTSIIMFVVITAFLLTLVIYFYGIPVINYSKAQTYLENGEYDYAIYLFHDLGDFKDAEELVKESNYQKANVLLQNMEFDEAIRVLSYIEGYKESENLTNEAMYQKALILIENGDLRSASKALETILNYKDSQKLLEKINE